MTEYLGICMVVIVVTLCIGMLSTLVTGNIYKQIEAHKKRVSHNRWAEFARFLVRVRDKMGPDIDRWLGELNAEKMKAAMKEFDEKTKNVDVDDYEDE